MTPDVCHEPPPIQRTLEVLPDALQAMDVFYLTITILAEAEDQGQEGMTAVAEVIRNRMRITGQGAAEVVLAPYQFAQYDNYMLQRLAMLHDARQAEPVLRNSLLMAREAIITAFRNHSDISRGAMFFATVTAVEGPAPPSHYQTEFETTRIGDHVFWTGDPPGRRVEPTKARWPYTLGGWR